MNIVVAPDLYNVSYGPLPNIFISGTGFQVPYLTSGQIANLFYPLSNPSGFGSGNGGGTLTGNFSFIGESGIIISSSGNTIFISQSGGQSNFSGNFSILGGNGINVSGSGQSIYINRSQGNNYTGFLLNLPSGINTYSVQFPNPLFNTPLSVVCDLENNFSNIFYEHCLNSVNNSGFNIFFSDTLAATGYILHTMVTW